MASLNIGATNADDAFYRYKMPKLLAKVEGRGNGIKTNIVNNVDIARALGRSPEYTLKFFGCELGAQTNFDVKTGVSILNGAHDAKKLQDLLEGFIKRFVQCYNCGNPETVIKIRKEFITLKCKACGFVSDVDMRHKLTTFIVKNPPDNKLSKEEARLKAAEKERLKGAAEAVEKERKKERREKRERRKKGEEGGEDDGLEGEASTLTIENSMGPGSDVSSEADDGVVWMTDTSAEAVRQRAEEQLTAATAAMVTQGNIEAERLEAERKAAELAAAQEAEEERQRQAAEEAAQAQAAEDARLAAETQQKLALDSAAAAASGNPNVTALRGSIEAGADVASIAAQLKAMTVEGGLAGKMRVLQEAAFGAPDAAGEKLAALLHRHKALFLAHARDAPGQLAQLVALEHFVAVAAPERAKEAALALKAMYDLDLADEDVILAWSSKQDAGRLLGVPADAAAAVRKAAAPLVQWLEENQSDDDDEEEEDDE